MEETEKRRERLKAMRMEAAQAEVSNVHETSSSSFLANPLAETTTSTNFPEQKEFSTGPRFNFYTDPMSTFSANKKRGTISDQIASDYNAPTYYSGSQASQISSPAAGPMYHGTAPSPIHQFQSNHPPIHNMYHGGGGFDPYGRPIGGMARPFTTYRGPPDNWYGPGNTARPNFPAHPMSGQRFPSPASRQMGSPRFDAGQGRVSQWVSRSPSPSSGQGRVRWQGSGRGPGPHGHQLGLGPGPGPGQLFHESMLEDPWKFMKPGLWKSLNVPLKKYRDSNSFGTKKSRVSESSNESSSQPSLAEYLAASFKETLNEAPNT